MRAITILLVCTLSLAAQNISKKTEGLSRMPGFFPLYWDAKNGKIRLEIHRWNTEFPYVKSLPAGVGSPDIGLDRGQIGQECVVRFERSGLKVLLVQPNGRARRTRVSERTSSSRCRRSRNSKKIPRN